MSSAADVMRELRAKEAEMETGRKREAALRVIIGRAIQQGFVPDDEEQEFVNGDFISDGEMAQKFADALVRLKQEKAAIQVSCPSLLED